MALILIRGENNSKLLNAIADMERHGNLNLATKPKIIDAKFADSLVEKILNSKLRTSSKVATAFFVKEDITLSIMQIKKFHRFWNDFNNLLLNTTSNIKITPIAVCILPKIFSKFASTGKSQDGDDLSPFNAV